MEVPLLIEETSDKGLSSWTGGGLVAVAVAGAGVAGAFAFSLEERKLEVARRAIERRVNGEAILDDEDQRSGTEIGYGVAEL